MKWLRCTCYMYCRTFTGFGLIGLDWIGDGTGWDLYIHLYLLSVPVRYCILLSINPITSFSLSLDLCLFWFAPRATCGLNSKDESKTDCQLVGWLLVGGNGATVAIFLENKAPAAKKGRRKKGTRRKKEQLRKRGHLGKKGLVGVDHAACMLSRTHGHEK